MAKGALRNVGPNQTPEYRTASSRKRAQRPENRFLGSLPAALAKDEPVGPSGYAAAYEACL